MISKEEFLKEFYSIVKLLREHVFLRYSDRLEYELKEKVASAAFLKLIYDRTGQNLPGDFRIIKINEMKSASFAGAKQIMKKVYLAYKKKSAEFHLILYCIKLLNAMQNYGRKRFLHYKGISKIILLSFLKV